MPARSHRPPVSAIVVAGTLGLALTTAVPSAMAGNPKADGQPIPKVGALKIPTKKPSLGTVPSPTPAGPQGQGLAKPLNPLPTAPGTPSAGNRDRDPGPAFGQEAPAPEGGDPYRPGGAPAVTGSGTSQTQPQPE